VFLYQCEFINFYEFFFRKYHSGKKIIALFFGHLIFKLTCFDSKWKVCDYSACSISRALRSFMYNTADGLLLRMYQKLLEVSKRNIYVECEFDYEI
jgi:hypothetical protein